MPISKRLLTKYGVVASGVLFALKLWAALTTGSIAVLSDALNSFLDVFSYSAIYISASVQDKAPDFGHHFGHRRAEPLAGLVIAVFAAVLGTNLVKEAVVGLVHPADIRIFAGPLLIIAFSVVVKIVMTALYAQANRAEPSVALHASFIDSRNDVVASLLALTGIVSGSVFDALAGLLIGMWIIISGGRIGLENIGYLMGKAPAASVLESMSATAAAIPEVIGINEVRAHYVGDVLHVEMHVRVPADIPLNHSHEISMAVRNSLEARPDVQRAFIHLEPDLPTKS